MNIRTIVAQAHVAADDAARLLARVVINGTDPLSESDEALCNALDDFILVVQQAIDRLNSYRED